MAYAQAYCIHTLEMNALRGWGVAFLAFVASSSGAGQSQISPAYVLTGLGLIGTAAFTVGAFLMSQAGMNTSQPSLMAFVTLMGVGMGLSVPSFLIAVQTTVNRRQLGTATSTLQFSRSMGGTLGVSVMGAALSARLASNLIAARLDPELVQQLLDPLPGAEVVIAEGARAAMAPQRR